MAHESLRFCPIPGCGARVPPHQLMDYEHWNLVPLPLQKTIVRLYHDGRPHAGYAEACANAVDQVVERLKERGE